MNRWAIFGGPPGAFRLCTGWGLARDGADGADESDESEGAGGGWDREWQIANSRKQTRLREDATARRDCRWQNGSGFEISDFRDGTEWDEWSKWGWGSGAGELHSFGRGRG